MTADTTVVLVVEDDASFRTLVAEWIGDGATLRIAETLADARSILLTEAQVDVALIDVRLPDGDGRDLISTIRRTPHRQLLPTVLMSAHALGSMATAGLLSSGADDFISKTIEEEEFTARLRSHVTRARRLDRAAAEFYEDQRRLLRATAHIERTTIAGTISAVDGIAELYAGMDGISGAMVVDPASADHPLAAVATAALRATVHAAPDPEVFHALGATSGRIFALPVEVDGHHRVLVVAYDPAVIDPDRVAGLGHTAVGMVQRVLGEHGMGPQPDIANLRPVFQPIVEQSGHVVGVEALSRTADGSSIERFFTNARRAGVGIEAELAAVEAVRAAATGLPDGMWVSINVTATALVDPRLPEVWPTENQTVVELTEHLPVLDYNRAQEALAQLPGTPGLSIDDAGAGYSCLTHVLRLTPDFVKLDKSWATSITTNPGAQALVVGVGHFTDQIGATLIAEGIETANQHRTVTDLGVPLTQGHLHGQAGPADEVPRRIRMTAA